MSSKSIVALIGVVLLVVGAGQTWSVSMACFVIGLMIVIDLTVQEWIQDWRKP